MHDRRSFMKTLPALTTMAVLPEIAAGMPQDKPLNTVHLPLPVDRPLKVMYAGKTYYGYCTGLRGSSSNTDPRVISLSLEFVLRPVDIEHIVLRLQV